MVKILNKFIDPIQFEASLESIGVKKSLTNDSIAMLFGMIIGIVLFLLFFIYLGYHFPWWQLFLSYIQCSNFRIFNCIYCYYYCCVGLERNAAKEVQRRSRNSVFVQDMYASPNGKIVHLSDLRPMCSNQQPIDDFFKCEEDNIC
jgi:hypothetical protein